MSCPRPKDMGNFKAVRKYAVCLERRNFYCLKNIRDKKCKKEVVTDYRKRFPQNPSDIDPSKRCRVIKGARYRCKQDPIRLVIKDQVLVKPPQPASGIKNTEDKKKPKEEDSQKPEERTEQSGPMPPIVPPPPPKNN